MGALAPLSYLVVFIVNIALICWYFAAYFGHFTSVSRIP